MMLAAERDCAADDAATLSLICELGGKVSRQPDRPRGPRVEVNLGSLALVAKDVGQRWPLKQLDNLSFRGSLKGTLHGVDITRGPVTSEHLRQLGDLVNLRWLDLGYTTVDSDGLVHLRQFPNLEVLNLDGLPITDRGLMELQGCPNLRELSLTCLPDLSLLKDIPKLQTLRIDSDAMEGDLDDRAKSHLLSLKEFPSLTTIDIRLSDSVLHVLREAGVLHKHIRASRKDGGRPAVPDDVTQFDFHRIPRPTDSGSGERLTAVTDAGLAALGDLPGLQVVDLRDTVVTDAGMAELRKFPKLCGVRLRFSPFRNPELSRRFPPVTDVGLKSLAEIQSLRFLELTGCKFTEGGLAEIQKLKELRTLNLDSAGGVTDTGLQHLAGLSELRNLGLAGSPKVTAAGLWKLQALRNLVELDLSQTNITNSGLQVLKQFPELRRLNLSGTEVTGAGLDTLADLRNLESLDLRHDKIDGISLQQLRGHRHLNELRMSVSDVTDDVLSTLREVGLLESLDTDWRDREIGFDDERQSLDQNARGRRLNLNGSKVTDAGLAELKSLTELVTLELNHSQVAGPGLKFLAGHWQLQTVDIQITDSVLMAMREANLLHLLAPAMNDERGRAESSAKVVWFDITGTHDFIDNSLTGQGLRELKPLVNLRSLDAFQFNRLTDAQILALGEIGLLHALPQATGAGRVRPASPDDVVKLDLSGSSLTDAGLKPLEALKNLRVLNLSNTQVFNLMPLVSLKKLEFLDVSFVRDSEGVVRRPKGIIPLSDALPMLRIRS